MNAADLRNEPGQPHRDQSFRTSSTAQRAALRLLRGLFGLFILTLASFASAALTIEIIGFGDKQIPIAIAPLPGEAKLPHRIAEIVAADLARSGLFRIIDAGGITPPVEPNEVRYGDWTSRGADALVIGAVQPAADGRFEVRFRLMDTVKQQQLAGFSYTITPAQTRVTAHQIADIVHEKLLGIQGAFATRITYVVKRGTRFELQIADSDGFGSQTVLASNEPIISPAWSHDGGRLAYVSFEQRKPIVYVHTLGTGERRVLAGFRGSNSAPAWSPDGRRLAVVLTRDGSSQIYLINADGSGVTRLTNSAGIDTEPNFSPDGQTVLFTSDRGGSPQIYRASISGGAVERLTFDGTYNVTPRFSPDGKSFVFVQRSGGRFNLMLQELATRQVSPLTDGVVDESPTFAPNGRMILYASKTGGRGILAAVSNDGRIKQRLTVDVGDVREPAWGPFQKGP